MNTQIQNILLSTKGYEDLSREVMKHLAPLEADFLHGEVDFTVFPDDEVLAKIGEEVKGRNVFLLFPLLPNPNEQVMRLAFAIDALALSGASSISLVLPYLSYSRQDRKSEPRVPISARTLAKILQLSSKVERLITFDLHAAQIEGFYDIPVDNVPADVVLMKAVKDHLEGRNDEVVAWAPDLGSLKRARRTTKLIGTDFMAALDKSRLGAEDVKEGYVMGHSVEGRVALITDDMIGTAGTALLSIKAAYERGAKEVIYCATHGLFTKSAVEELRASGATVFVTDTVAKGEQFYSENADFLKVVSVGEYLARVIHSHTEVGVDVYSITDEFAKRIH